MTLRLTPNAFVMSSGKGKKEAMAIAKLLRKDRKVDVRVWAAEFKPTELYQETLQRVTLQFDFGIAVITPDDLTRVDRKAANLADDVFEPRDNVIFEFGLFYSALGRQHVLPVVVTKDGARPSLPTDLSAMSTFTVSVKSRKALAPQLTGVVRKMRRHMLEHYVRPGLGLLPSTALAIGYFENFIKPVIEGLRQSDLCLVGDKRNPERRKIERNNWKVAVCVPQKLSSATRDLWAREANQLGLDTAEIALPKDSHLPRTYPFRVGARNRRGKLEIFDTPTTLHTVYQTVRKLMGHATRTDHQLADERGIADFCRALEDLVQEHGWSSHVEIIGWNELKARSRR